MDLPSPTNPSDNKRDLPARLEPTLLSIEAANLLHSVVYDAHRMGTAQTVADGEIGEAYMHLGASRMALVRYISKLEARLKLPQHSFHRFD